MSLYHLQKQYERLFNHFNGQRVETTLQHSADVLCCTTRNARLVLNKMVEQGWLGWQSTVGRGNKSALAFHRSITQLQMERIEYWFLQGKLETALHELDGDQTKLFDCITKQLGSVHHQGKSRLHLGFFRHAFRLEPSMALNGLEEFWLALIYNGLTSIEPESGLVQAGLAHHWQALNAKHWRFFLRNDIQFHDQTKLTEQDVVFCLNKIRHLPFFEHIHSVCSPVANVIDIHLLQEDRFLPQILARTEAKIYSQYNKAVGTGAYVLQENTEQRLYLERNSTYFGVHTLIDEIDIWLFNENSVEFDLPNNKPDLNVNLTKQLEKIADFENLNLENGCIYLLVNRVSSLAKEDNWAAFLSQVFNAKKMFPMIENIKDSQTIVPAWGLKPGWHHMDEKTFCIKPTIQETLVLAFPENAPLLYNVAHQLKDLLAQLNIELLLVESTSRQMQTLSLHQSTDIWLKECHFNSHIAEDFLAWVLEPAMKHIMPCEPYQNYLKLLKKWRQGDFTSGLIKDIGKQLIVDGQCIPLFHKWQNMTDFMSFISNKNPERIINSLWLEPKIDKKSDTILPLIQPIIESEKNN